MSTDNGIYISLLLEFYGSLLTPRQREILTYSVDDDLTLSEISELTGITRQGVRDAIGKAEAQLALYEEKLGMYKGYLARQKDGDRLSGLIEGIAGDSAAKSEALELVKRICG